jgi:hypothetical protein
MRRETIEISPEMLRLALGLPDGIDIVAVRETDVGIVRIKITVLDGVLPEHADDQAIVLDGLIDRPKCILRMVPTKGKTTGN